MRRMLVLALDGLPYSLAKKFAEDGTMPCLAALFRHGSVRPMTSVLPTVSAVAWSAFLTGCNPGRFGVFGFYELDPNLDIRIPNGTWLKVPTILQQLALSGRRVVSLGVPMTYPPDKMVGVVVGGFLAPSLDKAVHPPEMLPILKAAGYRLDVDVVGARSSRERLREDSLNCLAARKRALLSLISEQWDVFVCHVIETDRVNHYFWDEVEEQPARTAGWVADFYRAVDHLVGRAVDAAGPDSEVMVLSDHGFCRLQWEVQLNKWLAQEGYLEMDGDPTLLHFRALAPRSRAVALVPGRIHLLTPAFWRHGSVSDSLCDELVAEISAKLADLRHPDSGKRVCRRVLRRKELFDGPYAARAPDIVIEPEDGFDLKASLAATDVFCTGLQAGMHTFRDAFVYLRGQEMPAKPMSIMECTSFLAKMRE